MLSIPFALLKLATGIAMAATPRAPAAVIEDVTGSPPNIQLMDYVEPGQVIKLGQQDTIVISYLKSCQHEKITGGTVTVGAAQSEVQGGQVERSTKPCDGGKMLLTAQLAQLSAGAAFRAPPMKKGQTPHAQFTLYGLSPVFEVKPTGALSIDRIDQPGEHYDFPLGTAVLTRGMFVDLGKAGVTLTAGGVYRATAGTQNMVFKIDPGATSSAGSLAGRLVRLQPAN
ncbi:MAG TPA: hypothetical protein VH206_10590 [Xanthobacteraceae bacterium]|jgi:hypothetical protein|nr:hypothetical protein [Xanthobacteraceae bacterium]